MLKIYCIKDKLAGKFGPLQLCENEAVAQRMFDRAFAGSPDEYKQDFELVYLGDFDEKECRIIPKEC